jgi:hypothetical protein
MATMSGVVSLSSKPISDPASILFKFAFRRHVPLTFSSHVTLNQSNWSTRFQGQAFL